MKLILIAMTLSFQAIAMDAPTCQSNHWYSPDFKLVTGGEKCNGRVITCNYQGTKREGFYSYLKKTERRISWANCVNDIESKPKCFNRGSLDSGWYSRGAYVAPGICFENEEVVCAYAGTKNEGWFVYQADTRNKVISINCVD